MNSRKTANPQELPFSLYTRYQTVVESVERLRKNGQKFSILEVGGRGNLLRLFLKKDDITILDVDDSDDENYVKGDGRALPFADKSFDIVLSTDVLEHIPPKDRKKFLDEQFRVARHAIILSGPLFAEWAASQESFGNNYYRDLTGSDHPWLIEHIVFGQPKIEEVERVFANHKADYVKTFNQSRALWQEMLLIDLLVTTALSPKVEREFSKLNKLYNTKIFPYDRSTTGYRTIYTVMTDGSKAPKLKKGPAFEDMPASLLAEALSGILSLTRAIEEHYRDIIRDKDRHIGIIEDNNRQLSQSSEDASTQKLKDSQMDMINHLIEERDSIEQEYKKRIEALSGHIGSIVYSRKWRVVTWMAKIYCLLIKKPVEYLKKAYRLARRALIVLVKEGPVPLARKLKVKVVKRTTIGHVGNPPDINAQYQDWLTHNGFTEDKRPAYEVAIGRFKRSPKVSIVTPVYKTPVDILRKTIGSVLGQVYQNWELCLVDDGSNSQIINEYLSSLKQNNKIKVITLKKNKGIVEATNRAIKLATGEYIAFLDHDDELTPDALFHLVDAINKNPNAEWLYSDEDKLAQNGRREDPYFKPDYSEKLLLSQMYPCHLAAYKKSFGDSLGWLRSGYDGSQDYDLALRASEKTKNIVHISRVLYHWRKIDGSTAQGQSEKPYTYKTTLTSIQDALARRGVRGTVGVGIRPGTFKVNYAIKGEPLVSILIPTKDSLSVLRRCIESILRKTSYQNYEIIVLDNKSIDPKTSQYFTKISRNSRVKVIEFNETFNFSKINNFGSREASGEFLLFLNNDTEVITRNWLQEMLQLAEQPGVGAVGAKLLYPNNTIQHAGVVLGIGGIAGHSHKYLPDSFPGYFSLKDVVREYSAVTGACLMISRAKFKTVGGFDEKFVIAYNDVDLCLRLRAAGLSNIYTPFAMLYHHESVSVGQPGTELRDETRLFREAELMKSRWGSALQSDPYYNKNLSLLREDYSISAAQNKTN